LIRFSIAVVVLWIRVTSRTKSTKMTIICEPVKESLDGWIRFPYVRYFSMLYLYFIRMYVELSSGTKTDVRSSLNLRWPVRFVLFHYYFLFLSFPFSFLYCDFVELVISVLVFMKSRDCVSREMRRRLKRNFMYIYVESTDVYWLCYYTNSVEIVPSYVQ